ncbi:Na+/H+ antiporter subunit E [Microvirga sp. W0021]|uniref:Na+/H+ antiporter subunit E n=1 Tax=Hohaiivirga grylli TaxID=3133970 RepID=A0ABV0BMM9_9HYPH
MRRIFPHPFLSLFLMVLWLFLNQSLSLGHVILGLLVGFIGAIAFAALRPPELRIRNLRAIGTLLVMVLRDIVRSNIAVAKLIVRPNAPGYISGFMTIKLDMKNQYGLAALATIMTSTPGTLWVNFDSSTGNLLIHVLDLVDEETWIKTIKHGYERLLMEIFE